MHGTESDDLELAEADSLSFDSTHNFNDIDLDAVDFQPFLTNRSGNVPINYHSSDHPEHKLLIQESRSGEAETTTRSENDMTSTFVHMAAYALHFGASCLSLGLLQVHAAQSSSSPPPPTDHKQGLPRRYTTFVGVITCTCLVAISHIVNVTSFLPNMLVHKSELRENPSPHTIPKNLQDAYRDTNELPLGTLDTPVYWHLSPTDAVRANTTRKIMSNTCFASASDTAHLGHGSSIHVVVTQNLWEAANLLNATHRGRLFSMVRDPVERLISECKSRQKEKERLTLQDFLSNVPDNYLVRSLANRLEGPVDQGHLNTAKALVKSKLLVGLLEEQTESLRRIDTYFGWKKQSSKECRNSLLGTELQRTIPQHEKIESESRIVVEQQNHFDLELYGFIKLCFREQTALFKP
jgi:hypothetical protein